LIAIAGNLENWWDTHYRTITPSSVGLDNIEVKQWTDTGFDYVKSCEGTCAGSVGDATEPANVTSVISWTTGLRGRGNRGRTYVQALYESATDAFDTLNTPYLIAAAVVANAFIVGTPPAGLEPVVFHCELGTGTPITSFRIDQLVDSQRRRLPGRGT